MHPAFSWSENSIGSTFRMHLQSACISPAHETPGPGHHRPSSGLLVSSCICLPKLYSPRWFKTPDGASHSCVAQLPMGSVSLRVEAAVCRRACWPHVSVPVACLASSPDSLLCLNPQPGWHPDWPWKFQTRPCQCQGLCIHPFSCPIFPMRGVHTSFLSRCTRAGECLSPLLKIEPPPPAGPALCSVPFVCFIFLRRSWHHPTQTMSVL